MKALNDQAAARAKEAKLELTMRMLVGDNGYRLLGLDALPPEKQALLDKWISLYSAGVRTELEKNMLNPNPVPAAIETRIDGSFEGWDGDTVFKLANGQVWKQSAYAYTYSYAFSPEVVIYSSGSVFKMRVEGTSGSVEVTRIR